MHTIIIYAIARGTDQLQLVHTLIEGGGTCYKMADLCDEMCILGMYDTCE